MINLELKMHIHIYDLPTLATAGIALLMALNFLIRKPEFRHQVLGTLFLCGGHLQFILYLVHSENIFSYPHIFFFEIPLFFMIGPLQYFFVLSILDIKHSWKKKDILHFLPSILSLLYIAPLIILGNEEKKLKIRAIFSEASGLIDRIVPILAITAIVLYLIYIMIKILPSIRQETGNKKKLLWFTFFFFLMVLSLSIAGVSVIILNFSSMKYISFCISIFIIAQFIFSQRYPYLIQYTSIKDTKKEYSKSHLETMDISSLGEQINYLMEEEKFFCDEDLTLSRLSQALEITTHQLSQFLNEHHGKNFNTFINSYRIKESKTMLLEEPTRNALSIALAAGFNSYSAFFNAFKKEEGISPAEFRKKHQLIDS